jgi:hypothetical protein
VFDALHEVGGQGLFATGVVKAGHGVLRLVCRLV